MLNIKKIENSNLLIITIFIDSYIVIAKIWNLKKKIGRNGIWAVIDKNVYKIKSISYILILRLVFGYSKIFRYKKADIIANNNI